jgi:uncharacterized integral membrane protein
MTEIALLFAAVCGCLLIGFCVLAYELYELRRE